MGDTSYNVIDIMGDGGENDKPKGWTKVYIKGWEIGKDGVWLILSFPRDKLIKTKQGTLLLFDIYEEGNDRYTYGLKLEDSSNNNDNNEDSSNNSKNFQLITSKEMLENNRTKWIYIKAKIDVGANDSTKVLQCAIKGNARALIELDVNDFVIENFCIIAISKYFR